MEQITLSVIARHMQGIRPTQHWVRKGRSCLPNLLSFYDNVTRPVDEGKAGGVVYLEFSKASDTVCPQNSAGKAGSPQLGQVHRL